MILFHVPEFIKDYCVPNHVKMDFIVGSHGVLVWGTILEENSEGCRGSD